MSFDSKALLGEFGDGELSALVETMYLAADADGEFSTEERVQLATSIQKLAEGTAHAAALSGEALSTLIATASQSLESDGREKRLAAVKGALGTPAARKAALGLAIQVLAADGILRTSEREFIMETAEALEIDRDVAADLVRDITRPKA